jgi:acetamidase/formamidase
MRPFLGVMGLPPAEPGRHSTAPPRATGGNLDCRELVAGTTLFLPVAVEGALFSTGDGHASQGDGELSGTAIECPMDLAALTFDLRDDMPITTPRALTPDAWLTFGLDEDLDQAMYQAANAMLDLLMELHAVDRPAALALASTSVDLRITQVVNGVKGVHAILGHGAVR